MESVRIVGYYVENEVSANMRFYVSPPKISPENIILNSFDVCLDNEDRNDSEVNKPHVYVVAVSETSKDHNPRLFSIFKKCFITFLYTGLCIGVQINSSINGSVIVELAEKYHTSVTGATWTMALFMVGMGVNVVFCGPLTEIHGRKNVVCYFTLLSGTITLVSVFPINFKAYMVCRLFSGFFGSPALLVTTSVLRDLFNDGQRAYALLLVSVLIASMPSIGGLVAKVCMSHGIIQNLNQINLIPAAIIIVFGVFSVLFVEETFSPVINKRLESNINRRESLKTRIINHFNLDQATPKECPGEAYQPKPIIGEEELEELAKDEKPATDVGMAKAPKKVLFKSNMNIEKEASHGYISFLFKRLLLPYKFLLDPVVVLLTILSSYYSGSMYLHVTSFPSLIDKFHKDNDIRSSQNFFKPELTGIAFMLGLTTFGCLILLLSSLTYSSIIAKNNQLIPEFKLLPLVIGSIFITSSNFIVYSSDSNFTNLVKIGAAQLLHGAGFFLTQQSIFLYIMELYGHNSASASSLLLVARNIIGGCIPLFGSPIIMRLRNQAFLYLGIINIAFFVVICVLVFGGQYIRKNLKYCTVKTKYKNYDKSSA